MKKLQLPPQRAIASGSYQTSLPFKLVEDVEGFVMFMPLRSLNQARPRRHPGDATGYRYFVLIVLLLDYLLSDLEIFRRCPDVSSALR